MPLPAFGTIPQAESFHDQGLALELAGNYDDAQGAFTQALDVLSDRNPGYTLTEIDIQRGRVYRDMGFNAVRKAIVTAPGALRAQQLSNAYKWLASSAQHLGPLIDDTDKSWPTRRTREVRSEVGATTSLIGRLGTLKGVLGIEDRNYEYQESRYDDAAEDLAAGSNRYYEASNAMCAARAMVVAFDEPGAAAAWVSRAMWAGAKANANDWSNVKHTWQTIGRRLPDLRSKKAAEASVLARP
jgi:tetratricopeptide (TPR) repeat protein